MRKKLITLVGLSLLVTLSSCSFSIKNPFAKSEAVSSEASSSAVSSSAVSSSEASSTASSSSDSVSDSSSGSSAPATAISFHFLQLGNDSAGDCIYIKAGDNDILIDAGSLIGSYPTTSAYIDKYCTDKKFEYVIATHAHQDHIAAFYNKAGTSGFFSGYDCDTIIDFGSQTASTSATYSYYKAGVDYQVNTLKNTHYTAYDCYNELNGAKRVFSLGDNLSFEILDNYYYSHTSADGENDYSVCTMFNQGDNHFLLTGDLEGTDDAYGATSTAVRGETYLVDHYPDKHDNKAIPHCVMYKANHHGSKTSSSDYLLKAITPEIVPVTCVAGNTQYTTNIDNTFPTTSFINNIAPYTTKVYCVSQVQSSSSADVGTVKAMAGDIIVTADASYNVTTAFTGDGTKLKDTAWFNSDRYDGSGSKMRTWPDVTSLYN